jgi:hypothetical protein
MMVIVPVLGAFFGQLAGLILLDLWCVLIAAVILTVVDVA